MSDVSFWMMSKDYPALIQDESDAARAERGRLEYMSRSGTPTDEPLWAISEQVPFTARTAGVPLGSATLSAGGQTVVRNDATAASGIGPLLLILLAFWLMG